VWWMTRRAMTARPQPADRPTTALEDAIQYPEFSAEQLKAVKESMGIMTDETPVKVKGMSIVEVKPEMCGYPACR